MLRFQGEILVLRDVTVAMGGVYRCVADNNIRPPAQHLVQVLVFDAPTVRVVQDSVGQAQNRRFHAKLECIVQGKTPVYSPRRYWVQISEPASTPSSSVSCKVRPPSTAPEGTGFKYQYQIPCQARVHRAR